MSQDQTSLAPLHSLFSSTCIEVFESLNCHIEQVDEAKKILAVPCAHIAAFSDQVEMTLLLRGPVAVLKQTYPIKDNPNTIESFELDDWISELANRFMGSLKNKLLAYEHTLQMNTPKMQFGVNVNTFLPDSYEPYILNFQSGREVFECSLHTRVLNKNIQFILQAASDEQQYLDDGELEMF